jgi:hypothetical protein
MSFVGEEDIMNISEGMLQSLFKDVLDLKLSIPFPRMTYDEAIDRYGLEDPAADKDAGVFANETLQELYDQLVAEGSQSLANALRVGATIEEIDILDLEERIAQTGNADILSVFDNLLQGSYNHLRAFTSTLEQQTGEVYPRHHGAEYNVQHPRKALRCRGEVAHSLPAAPRRKDRIEPEESATPERYRAQARSGGWRPTLRQRRPRTSPPSPCEISCWIRCHSSSKRNPPPSPKRRRDTQRTLLNG